MQEQKKVFIDLFIDQDRVNSNTFNDWHSSFPAANGLRDKVSIGVSECTIFNKEDGKHARYWEIDADVSSRIKIGSLKDWSQVKTIAFTPGVIVPRYKMQKLKESTGLAVVRDMSKADIVITSARSISDIVSKYIEMAQGTITVANLSQYIMSYPISLKIPGMTYAYGLLNNLAPDTEVVVREDLIKFISYYHLTETQPTKRYNGHPIPGHLVVDVSHPGIFTKEGDEALAELSKHKLVSENDLNALLGESVIDADAYEMITKMIQSDNYDDKAVAISIVGNCNFVDSYKYCLAWFIKNIDKIMMCKQPVAFKAFRTFIGYEKIYKRSDKYIFHIDQLMEAALANNVYHDGFMEDLMQIDDLPISWEKSKLIKPVKFDITQEGRDIISSVNQVI
jgi:hypothetical protein